MMDEVLIAPVVEVCCLEDGLVLLGVAKRCFHFFKFFYGTK